MPAGGLEKAYLLLLDPSAPDRGSEQTVVGRLAFQFNPRELLVQKSAHWQRYPARGAATTAMPEFTGASAGSLALEVFLDATDASRGGVVADVDTLLSCLRPLPQTLSTSRPSPPFVLFGWGTGVAFVGLVRSVSVRYTLFRPDGSPVRASCDVRIEEVPVEPTRQNPTSGSPQSHRTHRITGGDSLASIAHQAYGDPALWRLVAEANRIDDPLALRCGEELVLPEPEPRAVPARAPGRSAAPRVAPRSAVLPRGR